MSGCLNTKDDLINRWVPRGQVNCPSSTKYLNTKDDLFNRWVPRGQANCPSSTKYNEKISLNILT